MAAVSAFRNLRTLSLKLVPPLCRVIVDSELQLLLKTWPRLEELSLKFFAGLRLAAIAKLCPLLKRLSLVVCARAMDDTELEGDAFPSLEVVELNMATPMLAFDRLFLATCGRLRRVRLFGESCPPGFLHLCRHQSGRISFPRLQKLTLGTNLTVRELGLEPEDLHHVVRALPALRHLETDSYDLRLFFENYSVPRGRISVSWGACVYCAVHDEIYHERKALAKEFPLRLL